MKFNLRYWLCQILGWGIWGLIIAYFNLIVFAENFAEGGTKEFCKSLTIFLVHGIIITHILRLLLKKLNWRKLRINLIIVIFVGATSVASVALFYIPNYVESKVPGTIDNYRKDKKLQKAKALEAEYGLATTNYYSQSNILLDTTVKKNILDISKSTNWHRNTKGEWVYVEKSTVVYLFQQFLLCSIWMLIYIGYHFVETNRRNQLDKLKLETTVKELELKTIKSHINPHFIFNSLNSIRALVDENPNRARTAITELSNILRSSMQAEKLETVPLKNELSIVKDYLELEHMRFEERLKIELQIDEDTLEQQVPPMMLQTLVENAIKHGISKKVEGGFVKVISKFVNDHHELIVQNSGQLNGRMNSDGFGIKSTEERLNLLYQGMASFNIINKDLQSVESRVILPVTIK